MRLRPDKVYRGYYKKELRPFKGKITNLKSNAISISSNRVINVGIIGFGTVGFRWHAVGLDRIKEVNIIGGYDIDPEKNLLFSMKYHTKNFKDATELLDMENLDLILISTREWQHYRTD